MNYGKLNEDIYERSVVKVMNTNMCANSSNHKSFYNGAGRGDFCAVFPCKNQTDTTTFSNGFVSAQASAGGKNAVLRAFETAVNHIVSRCGGLCVEYRAYADITFFVPEKLREIKVREMLAEMAQRADALGILPANVNVQVLPWISMETANCTIHMEFQNPVQMRGAEPGDDIVMTKWLGLEGTALIARSSKEELNARYPADIVQAAADFLKYLSVLPEAATAVKSGASDMQAVREGGIFGGLWELAARNGVGLVADLCSIPVRQETIEVCEYFDLNPYELMAGGSLLITCKNGSALVQTLAGNGIAAALIGKITEGNDRIIRHEGENRFLEPVRGDERYQYYRKKKEHDKT